jgi:NhaP-type Na+/H+ or K+/H+ antiporter
MIPVALGLIGTRMRLDTVLMMGWLGPRGLASVVFLIMAIETAREAQVSMDLTIATVSWTILLSVILHGFSALPLANWYGSRMEKADPEAAELLGIPELRARRRGPFPASFHNSDG